MEKYELLKEDSIKIDNHTLYRIRALRDFSFVKKDDLGGYVESEKNLSHEGDCWIFDDACVYGNARVYGNSLVFENACVNNACVYDNACVNNACVYEDTRSLNYE